MEDAVRFSVTQLGLLSRTNHIVVSHFRSHIGKHHKTWPVKCSSNERCNHPLATPPAIHRTSRKPQANITPRCEENELILIKSFKQPSKYISNHKTTTPSPGPVRWRFGDAVDTDTSRCHLTYKSSLVHHRFRSGPQTWN